jgi:hypothetical protein
MKTKPNLDDFLNAGAGPAASQATAVAPNPVAVSAVEPRKAVVVQLPLSLINELKRMALDGTLAGGQRVTQQSIIEDALRSHLKQHGRQVL